MIENWDNILSEIVGLVKPDGWDEHGAQEVRLCDDSIARVAIEHDGDIVDGRLVNLSCVSVMIGDEAEGWRIGHSPEAIDIYESYAQGQPPWNR